MGVPFARGMGLKNFAKKLSVFRSQDLLQTQDNLGLGKNDGYGQAARIIATLETARLSGKSQTALHGFLKSNKGQDGRLAARTPSFLGLPPGR